MNKVTVEKLETALPDTKLCVQVYYSKGGSAFGSEPTPRGYWLSVIPIKYETSGDVTWQIVSAYSGIRHFLGEAKVFSQKKLNAFAEAIRSDRMKVEELIAYVLEKNKELQAVLVSQRQDG